MLVPQQYKEDVSQELMCMLCRFAHMIGTREHTEYLWRITKDQDQHSHVAQEHLMG